MNFILKRAEDFGLTGERTTDKSGHITLGDSGKLCGVLTHLDVVPAGNSWSVPPYALTEKVVCFFVFVFVVVFYVYYCWCV